MIYAHLGKNLCKRYMYIRISCWFDKMKQNYWKPNRNLLRCLLTYDVFLSHDWGANKENHLKVKDVNERLKKMGYVTWFDEDVQRMKGDMDSAMSQGIEDSKIMLVFVTDAYRQKVNGRTRQGCQDNCYKEFKHGLDQLTPTKMLAVVMEKEMRNTKEWKGKLGMNMSGRLYVDLSNDQFFELQMQELKKRIDELLSDIQILEEDESEESMKSENLKVFVETEEGITITLDVPSLSTVLDLKRKLYEKTSILPMAQRLFFYGKEIEDDQTLSDPRNWASCHIPSGSILYVDKNPEVPDIPTAKTVGVNPSLMMHIFIKTKSGKKISLFVQPTDTVAEVKTEINNELGCRPVPCQTLYYSFTRIQSVELIDRFPLSFYNIGNGYTLDLRYCDFHYDHS